MTQGPRRRSIVVTGAAGFIGSSLVDRLLTEEWHVTALDAFELFYDRSQKLRNVASAQSHSNYRLFEVDTRDRDAVRRVMREARPSVVVDLAARAGVRPSLTQPQLYIDINVSGLKNTLDASAEIGAKVVFASSSSVYGADPDRPYREEQMDCRPESPYGATKIAGEALVHAHRSVTGLPALIARLFTVYGPRQRPDLAIHKFARLMLAGRPIELYDEGRASRDYTHVDDVVDALMRLIEIEDRDVTVNIGSHFPVTTLDLVDALEKTLGVRAERRLMPPQPGDVPATYADISRAREILGWEPRRRLDDGLASFARWLSDEPG